MTRTGLAEQLAPPEPAGFASEPDWLIELRASAASQVQKSGLPELADENWKYTSLRSLQRFSVAESGSETIAANWLENHTLNYAADCRAVFVDGRLRPDLGIDPDPEAKLNVGSVGDFLEAESVQTALTQWLPQPVAGFLRRVLCED